MIIRRLWAGERHDVRELYLQLNSEDRRLRFFSNMTDAAIEKYVSNLDFSENTILGAFDGSARLCGTLELIHASNRHEVELAIVVAESARGRGCGRALVNRAWEEARTMGCDRLTLVTLSENKAMQALADRLQMHTRFVDGDVESSRDLTPASPKETAQNIAREFFSTALWSTAKSLRMARELGQANNSLKQQIIKGNVLPNKGTPKA